MKKKQRTSLKRKPLGSANGPYYQGFATIMARKDGDIAIIGCSMDALKSAWDVTEALHPLNESLVQKVAIFSKSAIAPKKPKKASK